VLEAAYNDAAGVTARFNRNILRVMNDRLGADFDPAAFDHVAFYDEQNAWIEMRLRARRAQRVRIPEAGVDLRLAAGDEIRTEISCKYSRASLEAKLPGTGLRLGRVHEIIRSYLARLSPSASMGEYSIRKGVCPASIPLPRCSLREQPESPQHRFSRIRPDIRG